MDPPLAHVAEQLRQHDLAIVRGDQLPHRAQLDLADRRLAPDLAHARDEHPVAAGAREQRPRR
jgi:hypothetical protein